MEVRQVAGLTYFALTRCEVDFNPALDRITLLPTYYAFGCEYASRGFMLDRNDAFALIAAIEKALSVDGGPAAPPSRS
ncbi:hypothetical protein [Burkholderia plantarii]|uniref:Uncharacterized protein n=1 Tax=Burkholderia plantarii TaxID=41899 RepID=A0A0B6S1C9_BURPL|nr:hypothetical protein [Burkholderia plantarii]AJK49453.1 hypothetical protein BGL_2c13860 [Burkholderia plantarii]ALK33690.1 hypothetical protein bpln_2g14640 [Burkholderia plantarii]GLZ16862.1 hypothetical protein Bpla01_03920 [Burkholderia plantarii]